MRFNKNAIVTGLLLASSVMLVACDGDDGRDGARGEVGAQGPAGDQGATGDQGPAGDQGAAGSNSLVKQTTLAVGNEQCFAGGLRIDSGVDSNNNGELDDAEISESSLLCSPTQLNDAKNFNRIASFPVCLQQDVNCDDDTTTASEIVAASSDGNTLIYTDSPLEAIGFIDISNPEAPTALGTLPLSGEPTSVAVKGDYALVGVNTSADFVNTSGELAIVDIASRVIVHTLALAGQPDSVAVSPDGQYAAVAIENERDEDLGDGAPPQLPAGSLDIVDIADADVSNWGVRNVAMTGLAALYPTDPEPEYVDINRDNIAVVSLQENNHLVLVNLADGSVVNHFSAGSVDLDMIDATEEDIGLVDQSESLSDVLREPDGVTWLSTDYFVTANEGDLDGGSRGFSVFDTSGEVIYESGNTLDHLTARYGHYNEGRSKNKGNEPENAEFAVFGSERYLFVNSERSSVVFVYDVADMTKPMFKQMLPAAMGPEGALAIPSRNLLVVASEEDARDDKIRSAVNIYRYDSAPAQYATLVSTDRENGTPIPWAAMSGLAVDGERANRVYAVEDSFFQRSRIFDIDVSSHPARLDREMRVMDSNDVLSTMPAAALADATVDDDDASRVSVFDVADRAALLNGDKTVNLDLEGIAQASDGGFWLAYEGAGTIGDGDRPINSLNMLIKTDASAVIERVVTLPDAVNALQQRFGFEGVAEQDGKVYVAMQRAWQGETNPRIAVYDPVADSWSFFYYPLDARESQAGGWVGLSEITALGGGKFMLVERDNQGGPDAAIKRLYQIDVTGLSDGDTLSKTLLRDLMPDLAAQGGLVPEKIEGAAVLKNGDVLIINDNDGVDDNSGETQLLNLGDILP